VRRLDRLYALGLLAMLTLTVTACGGDSGGDGTAGAADPALQLASSVEAFAEQSFKFEIAMGDLLSATGSFDGAAHAGEMAMALNAGGLPMDMQVIVTGADLWVNVGEMAAMAGAETPWMHVDLSEADHEGFLGIGQGATDFASAAEMLRATTGVDQVDDRTFEGEIDLTRASSTMIDEKRLGNVPSLPFTATLDEQGRLTKLVVDLRDTGQAPADYLEIRYFDFGTPVEITPPPEEEVSTMPAVFYQLFKM
jgi:hypothetical protein